MKYSIHYFLPVLLLMTTQLFAQETTPIEKLAYMEGKFTCTALGSNGSTFTNDQSNTWLFGKKGMQLDATADNVAVRGLAAWDPFREIYYLSNLDSWGDLVLFTGEMKEDTITMSNIDTGTATINPKTEYLYLAKFKVYQINDDAYGLMSYGLSNADRKWKLIRTTTCTRK